MNDWLSDLWNDLEVKKLSQTVRTYTTTDFEPHPGDLLSLTLSFVSDPHEHQVLADKEGKDVDKMIAHLRHAQGALRRLHPDVLRALERGFSEQNPSDELVFLSSDGEPYHCYEQIERLIDYLVEGVARGGSNSPRANAIQVGKQIPSATPQSLHHETWTKIALIARARALWPSMRNEVAPTKPGHGSPFFKFVGDLIDAIGCKWDVESSFKAYGRHVGHG